MDHNKWNSLDENQRRDYARAEYFRRAYATNRRKDQATAILAVLLLVFGGVSSAMLIKSGLETKAKYEFSLCCETPNDQ